MLRDVRYWKAHYLSDGVDISWRLNQKLEDLKARPRGKGLANSGELLKKLWLEGLTLNHRCFLIFNIQ
jgi:hypothetical protein